LEAAVAYATAGGYFVRLQPPMQPSHHHARYTCEFNITQYGEEEEEEQEQVDGRVAAEAGGVPADQLDRRESVKDILVLELSAELESEEAVALPHTQAEAIRFQVIVSKLFNTKIHI
jgi:hypothetical protein